MIDLRIKNRSLDLDPGTSISMEINNPVFAGDILPGSFSMPFTIPASATNGKILGFPELVHLANKPILRYEAELIIEGVPVVAGELIFRGFTNDKYKVNFQSQISLLGQFFNDVNLRGLDHEVIDILDWNEETDPPLWVLEGGKKFVSFEFQHNHFSLPNPFEITVNGETYSDDNDDPIARFESVLDQINTVPGLNARYSDFHVIAELQGIVLADEQGMDLPLVVNIPDDPAAPLWTILNVWHDHYQPLIEAAIQSLNTNTVPSSDFVFPTYYNGKFYDSLEGNFTNMFNEYKDGEFVFARNGKTSSFIPMFSLAYVFRKIEENTGIKITGDFVEDPEIKKLILLNNHSLDFFENTFNDKTFHTYYHKIDPRNHIPDMSINEFLLELGKLFSLGFDFDSDAKTLELYFRRDIINNQDFVDISHVTNPRYEFDYGQNEGYTLGFKWNSKDELYNNSPGVMAPLVLGEGKVKSDFAFHTAFTRNIETRYGILGLGGSIIRKIPITSQPGTWSGMEPQSEARLLIYHGLQADSEGGNYPFASCDSTALNGAGLGDLSLFLQGEESLFNLFHKDWINFLMIDQSLTRESYWSIIDLLNYQFKSKYRIDQIRYLVPKISYTVSTRRGLGPVTLEMLKAE